MCLPGLILDSTTIAALDRCTELAWGLKVSLSFATGVKKAAPLEVRVPVPGPGFKLCMLCLEVQHNLAKKRTQTHQMLHFAKAPDRVWPASLSTLGSYNLKTATGVAFNIRTVSASNMTGQTSLCSSTSAAWSLNPTHITQLSLSVGMVSMPHHSWTGHFDIYP